jgi:hypothetical protein
VELLSPGRPSVASLQHIKWWLTKKWLVLVELPAFWGRCGGYCITVWRQLCLRTRMNWRIDGRKGRE